MRPVALLGLLLAACALPASPPSPAPARSSSPRERFEMGRDTFAFPNLVRSHNPSRPDIFGNYCIIMARTASQFFRFARFAPAEPPVSPEEYTRLARRVVTLPLWAGHRPDAERVVIPAYPDLHAFSRAQEPALKAAFGSSVLSMVHWRTWRVGFAFSSEHQRRVAGELMEEADAGRPAPLMITNFPRADRVNHAVLVYDYRIRAGVVEFLAYDPNDPGDPFELYFDPATGAFWIGPLPYGTAGRIRAFRLFASPFL